MAAESLKTPLSPTAIAVKTHLIKVYITSKGWPLRLNDDMVMALHKILRLSSEVDHLGSSYAHTCRDIVSVKETKGQIKRQLKEARDDLESLSSGARTRADMKLAKADKKTTICELEHRLALLRATMQALSKARDRLFSRREEAKVKMMEKMVQVMTLSRPVEITGSDDVAAVAKVMEWLRVFTASEVGRPANEESLICEIRDACQRFNVVGLDLRGSSG